MADKKAQLKELMKKSREERSQPKIDSPFAKYNTSGQLTCVLCKEVIKSESLWTAHLASKKHKSIVEALKEQADKSNKPPQKATPTQLVPKATAVPAQNQSASTPKSEISNSNSLVGDYGDEEEQEEQPVVTKQQSIAAKKRTFDQIESEESSVAPPSSELPTDFFDNPEEAPKPKITQAKQIPSAVSQATLPQGFFANREVDAKMRKTEPIDINGSSEYKKFQEMIFEDLEKVEKGEEEQEEQKFQEEDKVLEGVMSDRKKKMEELLKKAQEAKQKQEKASKSNSTKQNDTEDNSDDDLFNWRAKGHSLK